ncbi:T9SS type A sorting domain-containing protein [Brumimicrobium aurantiacum]|uniref:T9SS C-terminal target domain-containing protein n=1 Tax=Brumimicrobium aurantiacum TaxID=1737063 RepID=A0A3E1EXF9_9FLAO|nr:T9SS type A sorting domain-containing protein [Brumimicrobium aurantiacum]RFC54239.1 T9SS C-terminal target domain-containing protein [Brumimicrobium aurantiacum]
MRKILLFIGAITSFYGSAQIDVNQTNHVYTQDFNGLASTGTTNNYSTLPSGWVALETGSNADDIYRASDGYYSGGDLYSLGTIGSTERALGSVGSGSNPQVYFACQFVNQTTTTINSVEINFNGELWRVGNPTRSTGPDTLRFSYGINPTSIDNNAAFTYESSMFFVSPAAPTATANTEADGNLAANQTSLSGVLNINLAPQDTLWLRWRDDNSSSYDDALGVDDLTVEFSAQPTVNTQLFNQFELMNTYYDEDFDGLQHEYSGNSDFSTLPNGWYAYEEGGNANQEYTVSYGEFGGGNLYSFGDSASTERALGSIGSGSVYKSHIGTAYINTTSNVIENVEVSFTGEMWRQGRPARTTGPDTLHFSYAVNADGIDQGNYQDLSLLNFFSPVIDGILQSPMDGNAIDNKTELLAVIGNLSLQPMDTLWVRWTDFNSSSYDDGLAIDDFSIAAITTANILNVEFLNSSTTFNEDDGIVDVPLVIHNKNNFLSQVEVRIMDEGNVNLSNDIDIVESTISFPLTGTDSIANFQFNILNSEPFEGQEYFVLEITNPANAFLGTNIYDTIYIDNYDYPLLPIADLKNIDNDGVATGMGMNVQINGVVHGINYNTIGGVDFYVLENGKGINVYSMDPNQNYIPNEGDEVNVWGRISQFRGLIRLDQLDSIAMVSSNNTLETPNDLTVISESNEGEYAKIESLQLVPAISVWPTNQVVYAENINTGDTVALFVGGNSDLAQTSAPEGVFSAVGIGSQYASSTDAPFEDGYRLMLVNKKDVSVLNLKDEMSLQLNVYPNPANDQISIDGITTQVTLSIYALDGREVLTKTHFPNEKLNISNLEAASYILKVVLDDTVFTTTLIKQ